MRTALFDRHARLGAKTGEFAGYEMPMVYGPVKSEVLAVREAAGLFDVSHMGEILVEGEGAEALVDRAMCNDFAAAPPGRAVYSPLCNEAGGVVDDVIGYRLAEGRVLLCVNAANAAKDLGWLSSLREGFPKVSLRPEDLGPLALQGPLSEGMVSRLGLLPPGEFPRNAVAAVGEAVLARTGYTGEDGFEIFAPREALPALWDRILDLGAVPCGLAARDVLRIESGLPLYGCELDEERTPFESGLSWTVKLDRGDFVGKSALVAHIPRYRVVKLLLPRGVPRGGHPVKDSGGAAVGRVLSGTFSATLGKGICTALVERGALPPGEEASVTIRGRDYPASLHKGPFVRGGVP